MVKHGTDKFSIDNRTAQRYGLLPYPECRTGIRSGGEEGSLGRHQVFHRR